MSNIFKASKSGNLQRIKELNKKTLFGRSSQFNVNAIDSHGNTALYYASKNNHLETVKYLLDNNADANIQENSVKYSPLLKAAELNNVDIVKELLKNKAFINIKSQRGSSPLRRAAYCGNLETVQVLLDHKADINLADHKNSTPLFVSSENGHAQVVKTLLEHGASINITNTNNATPLHAACNEGHLDVVNTLLLYGCNINTFTNDDGGKFKSNATPLVLASLKGHVKIVQQLLTCGANVNTAHNDGPTALFMSSLMGHVEVVTILIQKEANVNQSYGTDNWTPLLFSSFSNNQSNFVIMKMLIQNGSDLNAAEKDGGITALHFTSKQGYINMVSYLLEKGAKVNAECTDKLTALHLAAKCHFEDMNSYLNDNDSSSDDSDDEVKLKIPEVNVNDINHLECVKLLVCHGADLNAKDSDDETALHIATQSGNIDIVKFLISKNAQITQNKAGNTPLDIAKKDELKDIETLLECYQSSDPEFVCSELTHECNDKQSNNTNIDDNIKLSKSDNESLDIAGNDKNKAKVIIKGSILALGDFERQVNEAIAGIVDIDMDEHNTDNEKLEGATALPQTNKDIQNIMAKISNLGHKTELLTELTDDYLLRIASTLKDDWSIFGGFLGVSLDQINQIEEKYGKNPKLAGWNLLAKWRDNTQDSDERKKQALKEAAVRTDRKDVFALIKKLHCKTMILKCQRTL